MQQNIVYIFAHNYVHMANGRTRILQQIIDVSYDPEIRYMIIMIVDDDEILQTASVLLWNNFSHFDELGFYYALNCFGNN